MRHSVSDRLVYCHEALQLRIKRTKAGYKEPAVKWESDSDSDENNSDNEEDLMVCPRSARASAPRALRAARSLRACTTS